MGAFLHSLLAHLPGNLVALLFGNLLGDLGTLLSWDILALLLGNLKFNKS